MARQNVILRLQHQVFQLADLFLPGDLRFTRISDSAGAQNDICRVNNRATNVLRFKNGITVSFSDGELLDERGSQRP